MQPGGIEPPASTMPLRYICLKINKVRLRWQIRDAHSNGFLCLSLAPERREPCLDVREHYGSTL